MRVCVCTPFSICVPVQFVVKLRAFKYCVSLYVVPLLRAWNTAYGCKRNANKTEVNITPQFLTLKDNGDNGR